VLQSSPRRTPTWLHPKGVAAAALAAFVAILGVYLLSEKSTLDDARALTVAPAFAKADPTPALSPEALHEPARAREQAAASDSERSVVSVRSAPPAAAVLQDGSELGVTPLDLSMSKGSTLTLLLKKKGFAEETLELRADDGSRVVTLRRLRDHERRERRSSLASRRAKERERTRSGGSGLPTSDPPEAPSPEKSSPYERF
jgi:hypothetical protein